MAFLKKRQAPTFCFNIWTNLLPSSSFMTEISPQNNFWTAGVLMAFFCHKGCDVDSVWGVFEMERNHHSPVCWKRSWSVQMLHAPGTTLTVSLCPSDSERKTSMLHMLYFHYVYCLQLANSRSMHKHEVPVPDDPAFNQSTICEWSSVSHNAMLLTWHVTNELEVLCALFFISIMT